MELCLDGRPDAYRGLVERHQLGLVAYLSGRLGDDERAEEVAQETLVRAFFSLGKLKKPESFFSWLLGIANRVIKEQNRAARRGRDAARISSGASQRQDSGHDPAVHRALAELPDAYREVVLLRYYAGLSCSQVADQLGLPLGTVTKRLSRAYVMLRETLRKLERSETVVR